MAETLTEERFQVIKTYDPSIWINSMKEYVIESGAVNSTYQKYTPSNFNNSQVSFSFTTPSPELVMDRHVYISYAVDLYDSNSQTGGASQSDYDDRLEGPRQVPLHSACTSLSASINGTNFSWNPDQSISAMLHYYKLEKAQMDSTCALMPDQRAELGALPTDGALNNDAINAGRNAYARPNAGFNMWNSTTRNLYNFGHSITQPNNATPSPFKVTFAQCEPLILPPFELAAHSTPPGLFGVSTFSVTVNFDYNRMWASGVLDTSSAAPPLNNAISRTMSPGDGTTGVLFNRTPILLVKYYTLPPSFQRPIKVTYPFYEVITYKSAVSQIAASPAGQQAGNAQLQTPVILVNSIPHRIYLYAKRALTRTAGIPDSFSFNQPSYVESYGVIPNINGTINNQTGIFSSATCLQLYLTSVKNGLEDITWPGFTYGSIQGDSNTPVFQSIPVVDAAPPTPATDFAYQRQGPGSVICLSATDLSLSEEFVSGSLGKFSIQFNATVYNPTTHIDSFELLCTVISEGLATFDSNTGTWSKQVGIVSSAEVLAAEVGDVGMVNQNTNVFGGSMFSKIRNFATVGLRGLRKGAQFVSSNILPHISHPGAATARSIIDPMARSLEESGYGRRSYRSGRVRSRSRPRGGRRMGTGGLL